jgi:hypothetical protein
MPRARLKLSCWLYTGSETGLSRNSTLVSRIHRESIAGHQYDCSAGIMRRLARERSPTAHRSGGASDSISESKNAISVGRRVSDEDGQCLHHLVYHAGAHRYCDDSILISILSTLGRTEVRSEANGRMRRQQGALL